MENISSFDDTNKDKIQVLDELVDDIKRGRINPQRDEELLL